MWYAHFSCARNRGWSRTQFLSRYLGNRSFNLRNTSRFLTISSRLSSTNVREHSKVPIHQAQKYKHQHHASPGPNLRDRSIIKNFVTKNKRAPNFRQRQLETINALTISKFRWPIYSLRTRVQRKFWETFDRYQVRIWQRWHRISEP